MDHKTAILIDGNFFLHRAKLIWGNKSPEGLASLLMKYCYAHMKDSGNRELYRIYYYDCPPASIDTENPISGEMSYSSNSPSSNWRRRFYHALARKRKVALRMGVLDTSNPTWMLSGYKLESLIRGEMTVDQLHPEDLHLQIRQKGVDLYLGMDMASLAYKGLVDQIVLLAGDSDFVPAAILVRTEGIDLVLDPMWLPVGDKLLEHVDGLRSMVWRYPDGTFDTRIGYRPTYAERREMYQSSQRENREDNGLNHDEDEDYAAYSDDDYDTDSSLD